MDEQFSARLTSKLAEYRTWSADRFFNDCRLVQYCGGDLVGAKSIPLEGVEAEIEGLLCEGFYVDWAQHEARLYLRVWEFGGVVPEWEKVFAEVPPI